MNICIIDDHKLITEAVEMALKSGGQDYNISVFNNPLKFLEAVEAGFTPDIVFTDLLMPQLSGMEVIETIRKAKGNAIKFVILSSLADSQTIRSALRNGANGFISKDSSLQELEAAVKEIAEGNEYVSPLLAKSLIKSIYTEDHYVFHLSPREREVLKKICAGMTVKEIAYELDLSANTVQTYQKSIMKKFKVNRTTDLVIFAIQNGLYKIMPRS